MKMRETCCSFVHGRTYLEKNTEYFNTQWGKIKVILKRDGGNKRDEIGDGD